MFKAETYVFRRKDLVKKVNSGLILMPGNNDMPMNYAANCYPFRQDSSFLYYFGLDLRGLVAVIDVEENKSIIFGNDLDLDDIIWMGPQPSLNNQAYGVGIEHVQPLENLQNVLKKARDSGRQIHFLPPYREEQIFQLISLLEIERELLSGMASRELIAAVIEQRSIKSQEEIEEIERAQHVTYEMHTMAMRMAKPGIYESDIAGMIEGIAISLGGRVSFPVILSNRSEILHNNYHGNILHDGDMVINDSGAETEMHYASDITRTFPVNGKFTSRQKDIYEIVLQSQLEAIQAVKPGQKNKDLHLKAATIIATGLKDLGLMKGAVEDAVQQGAHALFFPHGLGHMLGLDVHDMENLGEDNVGYNSEIKRSDQFGLAYLRLAKNLQPGFVITIEPGIYFIQELIRKFKKENKYGEFINYDMIEEYSGFGGIRIEDDVVVTDDGFSVVGKPIPKTVAEIEKACQKNEE